MGVFLECLLAAVYLTCFAAAVLAGLLYLAGRERRRKCKKRRDP